MSTESIKKSERSRRQRRKFTAEYRAEAVRLVVEERRSIARVAKDLDLTPSALSNWVVRARTDAGKGAAGALTTPEREELGRLRRENRQLRLEREILKKSGGLLREGDQVKFAWIDAERACWPVRTMCRLLQVSSSGYYAWRSRPESPRELADRALSARIREAHARSRGTYGSPRIHAELAAQGTRVSRKRVTRLMSQQGLRGCGRRRTMSTTDGDHGNPGAEPARSRLHGTAPNERWVGDVTGLRTPQGQVYLAVVLDLYARLVVGWANRTNNDRDLAIRALRMAVAHRAPPPGLMHHTDRGSPYASADYQRALEVLGFRCSMSRRGNCHDNAAMES